MVLTSSCRTHVGQRILRGRFQWLSMDVRGTILSKIKRGPCNFVQTMGVYDALVLLQAHM